MASRAVYVVLVVCLVAASGCSALGGSDTEDFETVTPVPVTTVDSTPTPTPATAGSFPPGVSANGTVDVDRLVAAHESTLANGTYRWEFTYRVGGDGGNYSSNFTRTARVGSDWLLVEQTSPGLSPNQSLFVTNETGYLRSVSRQRTQFDTLQQPRDHRSLAFSGALMKRFLTGVTADVSTVEVDGQTYYRLYASDARVPPELRQEPVTIRNYAVTAYVTPDGFVRSLTVQYERIDSRERDFVTARYHYTDLDEETVERPDWVSDLISTNSPSDDNGTATPDSGTPTDGGTPTPNGTAETPTGSPARTSTAQG